MNIVFIFLLSVFSYAKVLSMKDFSVSTDVSDIKPNAVKSEANVIHIDLGPDPLNMAKKTNYNSAVPAKRMLTPDQLVKQQPSPESIGRYYPGY